MTYSRASDLSGSLGATLTLSLYTAPLPPMARLRMAKCGLSYGQS